MVVNANMTAAPIAINSKTGKERVYIYSVAFVVPEAKANVIVSDKLVLAYQTLKATFCFFVNFSFNI